MRSALQDLRYGARLLVRSPGFSLVAIIALAIGIGANTAIFSVVYTLLLQRLPYRDADRLAIVWEHNTVRDRKSNVVAPANFIHWREMNQVFEDLATVSPTYSVTVTGNGDPEELQAQSISAELFQILGVRAGARTRVHRGRERAGHSVGRDQRSAVAAAVWRRSQDPRTAGDLAGHAIQRRWRHAAGLLVSRQERRRVVANRVHRAVTNAARALSDGRRPPEARDDRRARAARHDASVREPDARCSPPSTRAGRRAWCCCASS